MTRRKTSEIGSMGANAREPRPGTHAYHQRRYALRLDAGWSIADTAPRQKILADVLGVTQPNVSRQKNGQQDGTVADMHEVVRRAVREKNADAGALIAGCMVVAEDEASQLPLHEIIHRLCCALAQETAFECEENLAERELLIALGVLIANVEPTVRQLTEVRATAEQYERRACREIGRQIDAILYARALLRHFGWRYQP
jgi:hypothetical protein